MPKIFHHVCLAPLALCLMALPALVASSELSASSANMPASESVPIETIRAQISALLGAQEQAWNRGDIRRFMQGYWQSPDLRFASGGQITKGYEPTLARYLSRYNSPELMGRLRFDIVEIDVFSAQAAQVFGHWRLQRADDAPQGLFTLTVKYVENEWRIVSDHTSLAN